MRVIGLSILLVLAWANLVGAQEPAHDPMRDAVRDMMVGNAIRNSMPAEYRIGREDTLRVLKDAPRALIADLSRHANMADLRRDRRFIDLLASSNLP